MRSRSAAELGHRALGLLPSAATASAEGAWVAVVYAAFQGGVASQPLEIGLWTFVVAAAVGIVVARRVRGRPSSVATAIKIAFAALAGLAGWASDPAVGELVGGTAFGQAIVHHGAGWLLGLAAWRGTRHADPSSDDLVVGSLLTWAVPGLAIPWLLGATAGPRSAFVEVALPGTLLFVGAGLVAIGLTRLDALGRSVGVDWRTNRTWLALLVGVVGLVLVVGTPVAFVLGASIEAMARALFGPVDAMLGATLGAVGGLLGPLAGDIGRVVGPMVGSGHSASSPPGSLAGPAVPQAPGWLGTAIAITVGLVLFAGVIVLWRAVRGAPPPVRWRPPKTEERRLALPSISVRWPPALLPRLPRLVLWRSWAPKSATEAYLALLRDLERDEHRARRPTESPARHARRLRAAGDGSLSLDLLAADFELERYAGTALTTLEVGRAIRRWRACRRPVRHVRSVAR